MILTGFLVLSILAIAWVAIPRMADLTGFGQFLQNLRNQGMQPVLMGDFPAGDDPRNATTRRGRPYLVK